MTSLPLMPADMPIVHVRPRKYKGKPGGRALFKVDVMKLKSAFLWLKANNPYYAGVEWRDDAAAVWAADGVQVGAVREADGDSSHFPAVTPARFERWMAHARAEAAAGDLGHTIGEQFWELLLDGYGDDAEPVSDSAAVPRVWVQVRRLVADVFGEAVFRMAATLPQDILAVALAARGIVDLGLPLGGGPGARFAPTFARLNCMCCARSWMQRRWRSTRTTRSSFTQARPRRQRRTMM